MQGAVKGEAGSGANNFGLSFHHLGLAVREPAAARLLLDGLGYTFRQPVYDEQQQVNLVMADHPAMPAVEVIWSAGRAGPLDGMIARHADGIVYHLCYVTADLPATLAALQAAGLRPFCVSTPKPAVLFGGRLVSFYSVRGVGLVEVIDGQPGEPTEAPRLWDELQAGLGRAPGVH